VHKAPSITNNQGETIMTNNLQNNDNTSLPKWQIELKEKGVMFFEYAPSNEVLMQIDNLLAEKKIKCVALQNHDFCGMKIEWLGDFNELPSMHNQETP